jgi:hypothetical protein
LNPLTLLAATRPTVEAIPAQSLDQLWREAEQLGRVEVDSTWSSAYKVQIRFKRRGGTTIWATGEDTNIAFALAKAINEALDLGAGTPA